MKKFFTTLFWICGLGFIAYFALKFYKRIQEITKISKTLPEYIENTFGERPKMDLKMKLNSITITLKLSQETLDDNGDLEETVKEYIEDFYPHIASCRLSLSLAAWASNNEEPLEEEENTEEAEETTEEEENE